MSKIEEKAQLLASLVAPPALPRHDPHFVRNRDVMLRFLEGQAPGDIAHDLRLDVKQVNAILKRQPIKLEIQRLAGLANDRYVQERIDTLSIEALDVVRDTMRGENFNELRFKAAKEILDKNPLLKAGTQQDAAHALGAGLGEAIITRLAQLEAAVPKVELEVEEVKND